MDVDIKGSSIELATLIKGNPSLIEKSLFDKGNELVAFFEDSNFSNHFQNFKELKRELFCLSLEDLAMGGTTLRCSVMGLSFKDGKVKTFITPFGIQPQGNVMCSLSLKQAVAFKKWRDGEIQEIPQDDLNAALYRIIVALSGVI